MNLLKIRIAGLIGIILGIYSFYILKDEEIINLVSTEVGLLFLKFKK